MEGQFEAQAADHELGGFQESPKKCAMDTSQPTATPTISCFDCNICLEFAVDPVVTLCGHLYCWPCIYKWLQLESTTPPQCPVCKATFSQTTLVPLYGRGNNDSKGSYHYTGLNIPSRPSVQHRGQDTADSLIQPELQTRLVRRRQLQYHNNHNNYSSYGNMPTLRGTAVAVLPWVFGDHIDTGLYYSNPYYLVGSSNSPRLQRQEMHIKRSLHRISIFLLCCMLLCLLLF